MYIKTRGAKQDVQYKFEEHLKSKESITTKHPTMPVRRTLSMVGPSSEAVSIYFSFSDGSLTFYTERIKNLKNSRERGKASARGIKL
mmetsp:Transcript_33098/g.85189  ORF Transcript_33098/g.85189 Transcript_33098/m.85189 type:complete len:87 (-) Transcript_33098:317-577(-)